MLKFWSKIVSFTCLKPTQDSGQEPGSTVYQCCTSFIHSNHLLPTHFPLINGHYVYILKNIFHHNIIIIIIIWLCLPQKKLITVAFSCLETQFSGDRYNEENIFTYIFIFTFVRCFLKWVSKPIQKNYTNLSSYTHVYTPLIILYNEPRIYAINNILSVA